jgi:predicted nucleotidyltransferase
MKEKKLPAWVKNPFLYRFFQSKAGRIFSNWVLQGMLYMNPIEIAYKLVLDLIMMWILLAVVFAELTIASIVVSFAIAHTINWFINCQPIALVRHLDWGRNDPNKFIEHIEGMHERIQGKSFLTAAASFGSLSKGNYKPTSDIDIRVIMKPGFQNSLCAAHFCFFERVLAAWHRFPLDLYAFTLPETLAKMNPKEPPVIFYDPESMLCDAYSEVVKFQEFRDNFRDSLAKGDFQ